MIVSDRLFVSFRLILNRRISVGISNLFFVMFISEVMMLMLNFVIRFVMICVGLVIRVVGVRFMLWLSVRIVVISIRSLVSI